MTPSMDSERECVCSGLGFCFACLGLRFGRLEGVKGRIGKFKSFGKKLRIVWCWTGPKSNSSW